MTTARLSLNQMTVRAAPFEQMVEACAAADIDKVGLWRPLFPEGGAERARAICEDAGLAVTSLCRGGFFTGYNPDGRALSPGEAIEDTRQAIDECVALGTDLLVLVCGGSGTLPIGEARDLVARGIAQTAGYAAERGIRLGIEPLHPMFCADRSVITTIAEALRLANEYPPERVGLVIDAYHVWWDPELERSIAEATGRIAALHVCDWELETREIADARVLPGRGVIDLRGLERLAATAGYDGPIEVEVLSRELWKRDALDVARKTRESFEAHVA